MHLAISIMELPFRASQDVDLKGRTSAIYDLKLFTNLLSTGWLSNGFGHQRLHRHADFAH